ncbi:glycosyltransferase [Nakamurella multipartita]|uniref:Glycosyl transferase group 1 n=1 Tax=Nakamurella multipartita (strain ATCC 700099 / DSM 44233 / CIP 104796 / JCM 9543 / NBRC 105858 / Y-104) TaxID=479431 RepID=C8X901_NAKMY|nr:glycosyltransferase [Nakamurella multipartita]ACV81099.1 glycosyl transferase group 1 [Nakamurella multipartita DSM 44233]
MSLISLSLHDALAKVRDAPFLLDAIRASESLTEAAGRDGGPYTVKVLTRAVQDADDQLMAIAAVHGLGAVFDEGAGEVLSALLSDPRTFLREHAAWALGSRVPRLDAIGRLISGIADGGFATVINQRALRRWAQVTPDHIALALEGALLGTDDPDRRARLMDTMGLVPGPVADAVLLRAAADERESSRPRQAAIAAIGDRRTAGAGAELIHRLARSEGELAGVARLAAFDLAGVADDRGSTGPGLAVAQLFLHADLDRELSRAGAGDNGGIATMLVRLGDALAAEPGISRVLTLSRGTVDAAVDALIHPSTGHVLSPVPLMAEPTDAASAWPVSVAAERGIRRALTSHGRVDVMHLRMADVGSMAAAAVATRLGIPTVFTLAPDPHAVIHALDMTGALTRATFGAVDEREHYWFRTGLVARLAAGAQHRALFPRPDLREQLRDLLGIDIRTDPGGSTVVPEGIDVAVSDRARAQVVRFAGPGLGEPRALNELADLVAALPEHRRGLPLALSVGRLHRVKGMATVVEAWAAVPALRDRCNLLIVGGDLQRPSVDERDQLDRIAGVIAQHPDAAAGLLLPGHRPNDVIAAWMAAAQLGLPGSVAPGGVYVCGSLKEEFGLAVIEALAAGLPVVAPDGGGPATYVEEGVTGFLVDTRSPRAVAGGLAAALELPGKPGVDERLARARATVTDRFTLQAMARTLAEVYAGVTAPVAG